MDSYLIEEFDYQDNIMDILEEFRYEEHLFFLDSSQDDLQKGRFSFIGFDPFNVVEFKGENSHDLLKKEFKKISEFEQCSVTPLPAGMVGILGYDYCFPTKKIQKKAKDDWDLPDCIFGFYDRMITIDHQKKKLYVTSSGLPEKDKILQEKRAKKRLAEIIERLPNKQLICVESDIISDSNIKFLPNFSKEQYCQAVEKALDYIAQGDIYQVNLSQRFEYSFSQNTNGLEIYKYLRRYSPSSYSSFFKTRDFEVMSSSPELFLELKGDVITTRPMKGTRSRGIDQAEDKKLRNEIEINEKERAELLMITDLERNDLGKVCEYGSVYVDEMRTIEEYSTVFQAVSSVKGKLRKEKDAFDVIEACFPGGSITGCPKMRAMEIIEELEPTRRGVYTGSLGYISFSSQMQLNILIRTLVLKKGKLYFQVGGGIVADSIPEKEYEETLIKAKAMKQSLKHFSQKQTDATFAN